MVEPSIPPKYKPLETHIGADYSADELEFIKAMERYKREHRRPFPTLREVLYVLKSLRYAKPEACPDADS